MMDPQRLVLGEASDFERLLLEAGTAERIPPETSARMAAVLGLPFALQTSLPPPPPPAVATGATSSATSLSPLLLTLGVGCLVIGGAVGGMWWKARSTAENATAPTAPSAPARRTLPHELAARPSSNTHGAASALEAAEPPNARGGEERIGGQPVGTSPTVGAAVTRRAAGDIAAEVRLLDRARAAIAGGDRQRAMQLLGRYDAEFPRGELRREARVLRTAAQGDPSPTPDVRPR